MVLQELGPPRRFWSQLFLASVQHFPSTRCQPLTYGPRSSAAAVLPADNQPRCSLIRGGPAPPAPPFLSFLFSADSEVTQSGHFICQDPLAPPAGINTEQSHSKGRFYLRHLSRLCHLENLCMKYQCNIAVMVPHDSSSCWGVEWEYFNIIVPCVVPSLFL